MTKKQKTAIILYLGNNKNKQLKWRCLFLCEFFTKLAYPLRFSLRYKIAFSTIKKVETFLLLKIRECLIKRMKRSCKNGILGRKSLKMRLEATGGGTRARMPCQFSCRKKRATKPYYLIPQVFVENSRARSFR